MLCCCSVCLLSVLLVREIDRRTWKHFRYIVKLTCTCCEPYDMIENKLLESKSSTWNLLANVALHLLVLFLSIRYLCAFLFRSCSPPLFVVHFMYSLLVYPIRLFFVAVSAVVWTTEQTVLCYHYFLRERARVYFSLALLLYLVVSCTIIRRVREFSDFKKYRWSWMHTQILMHMHSDTWLVCSVTGVVS